MRSWLLVSTVIIAVVIIAVCALALDADDGIVSGGDHDGAVERHRNGSDKP